jgi:hypothetical protein
VGAYNIRSGHLTLIARQNARYSLRGGTGIVFMLLTFFVGLMIAHIVITPAEVIVKDAPDKAEALQMVVDKLARPAIKWWIGASDAHADYLLTTKPALVSVVIAMLLTFLPFLVALGAANQTAGDIGSKGLRYLLFRTERANIFFGRFIGTYIFTLITLAMLMGVVFLYLAFKAKFYAVGDVAMWSLQGYVALAFFALPYVALCAWFSASSDGFFVALVLVLLVIIFVPLIIMIASIQFPNAKYAGYITPWPLRFELLHPEITHKLGAAAAMVGFTAVFLFIGARHFQKRDL